jgi:hypothetical protein
MRGTLRAKDLPACFPHLADLWLYLALEKDSDLDWNAAQVFPTLKRIRLCPALMRGQRPKEGDCYAFKAFLAELPTLTHLYISAQADDYTFPNAVASLLDAPSSLEHVYITVPYMPENPTSLIYFIAIKQMLEICQRLADSDDRAKVTEATPITISNLLFDWLSRMW